MRANEPQGVANLDPRGMVSRIYVGDHLTLLQTKYLSSEPYGFREEDFFMFFPIISLWELMSPRTWPIWTPGAWLAGFMQLTTYYCYVLNI